MAGDTAGQRQGLSESRRLNWLRLIRCDNVGPATFRDLLNHFGSAAAALEALPELAKRGGVAARIKVASIEDAEREMALAERHGARFIAMGEAEYPPTLRALDHPPPLLCIKGDTACANRVNVGIVGSRNASISGMKLAARIAGELSASNHCVVSGLARGIDASAHRASAGGVAVLAGGIDRPYPEEHGELAAELIANGGMIVSEMPVGWTPRNIDFPRRNRIIAGLSHGVLVVEAAKRSGSLITARLANEAGRVVFAIPGSPLDPRAEGANQLIKQGATLVTGAQDIIDVLAPSAGTAAQLPFDAGEEDRGYEETTPGPGIETGDDVRKRILSALGPSPAEIDDILRYCNATAGQVQLVLLELDLAGRIERHGGNRVSLLQ